MKNRIRRSRAFWEASIESQLQSGQTISAWCQQRQLAISTFCKWKRKLFGPPATLATEESHPAICSMIELTPIDPAACHSPVTTDRPPVNQANQGLIEASLANGTLLRFHAGVQPAIIAALIDQTATTDGGQR